MATDPVPQNLNVPMSSLVSLAVECWRLKGSVADDSAPARHALRRIGDFLRQCELDVQDLTGRPFDAGMAARVVDTVDDPQLPAGVDVVDETLSPMVLWRGEVVRAADVVTRRGSKRSA